MQGAGHSEHPPGQFWIEGENDVKVIVPMDNSQLSDAPEEEESDGDFDAGEVDCNEWCEEDE